MLVCEQNKTLWNPPLLAERDHFLIKLAETPAEVKAAQRLRYEVFAAEQGRLEGVTHDQLDVDEFDEFCLHLVVVDRHSNEIVGTYRVHPGEVAIKNLGFYSSREYRIAGLEKIAPNTIEVGRSCVRAEFRNGAVVALLWSGLAELHRRSKCDYLLGCVSMETTDAAIGWALYEYFQTKPGLFSEKISALPMPGFELEKPSPERLRELTDDRMALLRWIPPLLKGYLRVGVKLASVPVIDHEFGAIDFLILFDFADMEEKYARHFL